MSSSNDARGAHLTEDERQGVADGSLSAARVNDLSSHLETCDACAADIARLGRLMTQIRASRPAPASSSADDLWPEIRSRIEERKILSLPSAGVAHGSSHPSSRGQLPRRRAWMAFGATATAAAVLLVAGLVVRRTRDSSPADISLGGVPLISVAESTQVYESEAQTLLGQLELQRAMLRPETAASIDKSLRVIDQAIAELRDAVAHDPNNPALRRLLASSYRQKVELLKQVGNAS